MREFCSHQYYIISIIPEGERLKAQQDEEIKFLEATIINQPRRRTNVVKYTEDNTPDEKDKKGAKNKKKTSEKAEKSYKGSSSGAGADPLSFAQPEIRALVKALRKFGSQPDILDVLIKEAELGHKEEVAISPFISFFFLLNVDVQDAVTELIDRIKTSCKEAIDTAKREKEEKKANATADQTSAENANSQLSDPEDDKDAAAAGTAASAASKDGKEKKEKEKDPTALVEGVIINAHELVERLDDLDNLRRRIGYF